MSGHLRILLVVYCLAGIITVALSRKEEDKDDSEAVLGVHVKILPEPLWYNVLVPILFEIPLPKWSLHELSPKWPTGFGSVCTDDHYVENWSSIFCPVDFHLDQVVKRAYENLFPWSSLLPNLDEKPIIENFQCDNISPHFKSYVITEEEEEKYLTGIKQCPPGEHIYVNVTKSVKDIDADIYDTMLSRFIDEFSSPTKYRMNGFVKYPTALNTHMSIQIALLLEFYETSRIYSDALASCQNQRLPPNIVSKVELNSALEEAKKIFSRKNYDLTLPQSDLDVYYRKELTDCILTTRSTLIVRLLVPLRKLDYPLQLFRLIPMEFIRTVGTVEGNKTEICHFGSGVTHYIKDENFELFFATECEPEEFCKVPDITMRIKVNSCVQSLLAGDRDKVLNHCNLICEHAPKKSLPVFRRIDKDRYVIAGKSTDMEIFVSCGNKPFKVVTPPADFGALEVILPCNCQIVYKTETLYSYGDCLSNVVSLKPIIPHHWSPMTDLADYLDDIDNVTLKEAIQLRHEAAVEEPYQDDMMFYVNLQFTIISVVIIVLIFTNIATCYLIIGIMQRLHKLPGLNNPNYNCHRLGTLCPNNPVFNCDIKHDEL